MFSGWVQARSHPRPGLGLVRSSTESVLRLHARRVVRVPAITRSSQIYSIRRPEIARAMTSCWISDVPSKIVWIRLSGSASGEGCSAVPSTSDFVLGACWPMLPIPPRR